MSDFPATSPVFRASRLNSRQQQIMLEAAGVGLFAVDGEGRCTFVNPAGARLIGYAPEEVLGEDLEGLLAPPGVDAGAGAGSPLRRGRGEAGDILGFAEATRTGVCRIAEARLYRKDGTYFDAECLTSPMAGEEDGIAAVLTLQNVTPRKAAERSRAGLLRAEKTLRQKAEVAERRASFLAEASDLFASSLEIEPTLQSLANIVVPQIADSCVIYLMDEAGVVQRLQPVHVDPRLQRILAEQFERHPPEMEHLIPPVKRALQEGEPSLIVDVKEKHIKAVPGDTSHRSSVAGVALRSLIAVPLRARGRILGAITYGVSESGRTYGDPDLNLAEDLAARAALALDNARLYEESRSAVRARNDVLGIVSHDLRNPLNAVRFGAQALLRHWPPREDGEAERNQLAAINKAANRMHRLIHDLLDIVHLEAGRLAIAPAPFSVPPLLGEALDMVYSVAAEKSIQLTVDAPEDLPEVTADSGRLLQVLANLLHNAIKFSPAGSQVEVGAYASDEEIVFSVHDRGCGIEEEHLPHVFEGFWRAQRGAPGGSGLGLAIARGIVESHGGKISVHSIAGFGSTFSFTIPVNSPHGVLSPGLDVSVIGRSADA
jgi:signal transduction histidine kinase